MNKWIFQVILGILPLTAIGGSNFDEGIRAFRAKKFDVAIKDFLSATDEDSTNVSAYYNLGLTYMEVKEYGEAIWSFEKVLKYSPNDGEAKERIRKCYEELDSSLTWEPRANQLESALFSFAGNTWSIICILLSVLTALCIILFKRTAQTSLRRLYLGLGSLGVIFLVISLIVASRSSTYVSDETYAIVTEASIPTYKDEKTAGSVELKEGERVQILSTEKNGFKKVQTSSGASYLVKKDDLAII